MSATIIDRTVPDGDVAVDYTVLGPMCGLATRDVYNPCVRAIAARLKAGARSDVEAVRRAFEHVVRTIPYVPDPETHEQVTAPIYTLGCALPYKGYRPHGDCDCQATALYSLLVAMGYEPQFRVVAWRKWDYTHVNIIVRLPSGEVIPLDAVMKMHGWRRQKPAVYREKLYRCPNMKVRALADGADTGIPPAAGGSRCGCARCRSGGNCGRRCCPRNAATASGSPVTVNVNTGRIQTDARRWTDASERADIRTDGSRWVQMPSEHDTRRSTIVQPVPVPARPQVLRVRPERSPVYRVTRPAAGRPVVLRAVKEKQPLQRFKEFA